MISIAGEISNVNNEIVSGKETEYATTEEGAADTYELGGRTVKAVELSGTESIENISLPEGAVEIVTSFAFIDDENHQIFTSEYLGNDENGEIVLADEDYTPGGSYYALVGLWAKVNKLQKAVAETTDPTIFDGEGKQLELSFLNDLATIMDKIMNFDDDLIFDFDTSQVTSNYIAENGSARLVFHVQTNGLLGRKASNTSIEEQTLGRTEFLVANYEDKFLIINNTDLQNTYMVMNDEEALLIDADQFGGEDFVAQVKKLVGDRKLYLYLTHGHADHWTNLQYFDVDDFEGIYYPENEPASNFGGDYDLLADLEGRFAEKVTYVKDGDSFSRAGKEFEVIHMGGHTPNGTALLDITDRILFSGDTLGSQIYKGGTNLKVSQLDTWVDDMERIIERTGTNTDNCKIDGIFGGHTPYLMPVDYINWMATCVNSYKESGDKVVVEAPTGNLVVTYNGELVDQEEYDSLFAVEISDAENYKCCSISINNDLEQETK